MMTARCLRQGCSEARQEGYCLCEFHMGEVLRGEARPPPIRRNIDYIATAHKTFLVMELPTPPDENLE